MIYGKSFGCELLEYEMVVKIIEQPVNKHE